ncbi:MAG TPA: hypothetical protein VNE58_00365 [Casimicrobiaceae bacterium]|nr:hypothetical protein [Casimicrobiaceae bacterium]
MQRYADRRAPALSWFEFGLALFASAVPVGIVVMLIAPVSFFHALGALILGAALIGLWVSALGLRLEYPDRWSALKRRFGLMPAPARIYEH